MATKKKPAKKTNIKKYNKNSSKVSKPKKSLSFYEWLHKWGIG